MKSIALFLMLIGVSIFAEAQVQVEAYGDIGENNVSEGAFIKSVFRAGYEYDQYRFMGGVQLDLYSSNPNLLSGFDITTSRNFLIKDYPVNLKGYYILNRFSDLMYETNWGLRLASKKYDRFALEIGSNFKTYTINANGRAEHGIAKEDCKLREFFNLTYLISGYVMPHNHNWNLGLTITNIDYYTINQSTNPIFNLQMKYDLKPNLSVPIDSWYKQAGIFNIYTNYFGYFFRGGVK